MPPGPAPRVLSVGQALLPGVLVDEPVDHWAVGRGRGLSETLIRYALEANGSKITVRTVVWVRTRREPTYSHTRMPAASPS